MKKNFFCIMEGNGHLRSGPPPQRVGKISQFKDVNMSSTQVMRKESERAPPVVTFVSQFNSFYYDLQ